MCRRVDWRSGPSSGPVSSRNRSPSRSRTSTALIAAIRAAASSMPRGRPSSVSQISITAPAVCSSKIPKPGRTARARSTNSVTASDVTPSTVQRRTRHERLARRAQLFARRREDAGHVGAGQDLGDGRRGRGEHVLAVVDHDEQAPSGQRLGDRVDDASVALRGDAEGVGDGVGNGVGVADGLPARPATRRRGTRRRALPPTARASRVLPTPPTPLRVTSGWERTSEATSVRTRDAPDEGSGRAAGCRGRPARSRRQSGIADRRWLNRRTDRRGVPMDDLTLLAQAERELAEVITGLDDAEMDVVSNCPPWTVRRLASHALKNQLFWAGSVTGQQLMPQDEAMAAVPYEGDLAPIADRGRRAGGGAVAQRRRDDRPARHAVRRPARRRVSSTSPSSTPPLTPGTCPRAWAAPSSSPPSGSPG